MVSVSAVVGAPGAVVFAVVAEPALHPVIDGNDNVAWAPVGQRIRAPGQVFVTVLRRGSVRLNHVCDLVEGIRVAWMPSEAGRPPPGHRWAWEVTDLGDGRCAVTHTYDWSGLTDPDRMGRARWTTPERLTASVDRLRRFVTASSPR